MFDRAGVRGPWESGARECLCVVRHVPSPSQVWRHHVWPVAAGGPDDDPRNLVWLCPTSLVDVRALLDAYDRTAGVPGWPTRRVHNPYVRMIAHAGWLSMSRRQVLSLGEAAVLVGYAGRFPTQQAGR